MEEKKDAVDPWERALSILPYNKQDPSKYLSTTTQVTYIHTYTGWVYTFFPWFQTYIYIHIYIYMHVCMYIFYDNNKFQVLKKKLQHSVYF